MDSTITNGTFVLASNNLHKLTELRHLTEMHGIDVVSPKELGLELEVPETGTTFEENAVLKARAFSDATGLSAIADDSGLVVDALDGAPGIYSARYGGPELTDRDRNHLILRQLEGMSGSQRSARFIAVIAVVTETGVHTFEGRAEGKIALEARGENGFGYDPIFLYTPFGRTFAEMRSDEKSTVSHRSRALTCASRYIIGLRVEANSHGTRET